MSLSQYLKNKYPAMSAGACRTVDSSNVVPFTLPSVRVERHEPQLEGLVLRDLPIETYHSHPSLSGSLLKHLDAPEAGLTFWHHSWLNPQKPADVPTASKHLGSAGHCMVLEPALFKSTYRFKPCKTTTLPNLLGNAPGGQWDRLQRMHERLMAHPDFQDVLHEGMETEISLFTNWHTLSGQQVPVRCRPDILTPHRMVNLKFLRKVDRWAVSRAINEWRYDQSSAFYTETLRLSGMGTLPESFFFIETYAPFRIMYVPHFSVSVLEEAHARNVAAVEKFSDLFQAHGSNPWPDYAPTPVHALGEGGHNALTLLPRREY